MTSSLQTMSNCISMIAVSMIEKASSGHPGIVLGISNIITVLFSKIINITSHNPTWISRDRFVISAGHGSSIIYAVLHMLKYDISMEDLKSFRQFNSKTPGHPELNPKIGIDVTTGPLGQGIANAVGIAIAERKMNSSVGPSIEHKTYCIVGDGCLMEGISHEAASLAGHLKLSNLIVIMDSNKITIDGATSLTNSENTKGRFESYMWNVVEIDGHSFEAIEKALINSKHSYRPTLIICNTIIGKGTNKKENSSSSHGSPLGADEYNFLKNNLGWQHDPFEITKEYYMLWDKTVDANKKNYLHWKEKYGAVIVGNDFNIGHDTELQQKITTACNDIESKKYNESTRESSKRFLELLCASATNAIGGSSDLSGSNCIKTIDSRPITADNYNGNYIHYGIREHAMCAIMNGIALHSNILAYGGTFLVFLDYARPSIRLSALMGIGTVYIATHDSIGVGEDGPTHQPVEHLAALRAIPNLFVFRPADVLETMLSWKKILKERGAPSVLVLSRQKTQYIEKEGSEIQHFEKGCYIIKKSNKKKLSVTIISTGTELYVAINVSKKLEKLGIGTQVISAPCFELFEIQPAEYKEKLIPKTALTVGIEAASSHGWHKYIGPSGLFFGVNDFGKSAPAKDLFEFFELNEDSITKKIIEKLENEN